MATKSTIVTDEHIQQFKDAIDQWKRIRVETQLAIDAGFTPELGLKDIDKKIADNVKIIEAYTGQPYRV